MEFPEIQNHTNFGFVPYFWPCLTVSLCLPPGRYSLNLVLLFFFFFPDKTPSHFQHTKKYSIVTLKTQAVPNLSIGWL